jgi:flagellar motor switch protein FliN/FliY
MPADLKSILNLEVPLIVVISHRDMPVREVMNLAPGAILELPKAADEDLEVMVNNKPIGAGRAVKVGENFGVRVTYVGDIKQRIEAMGSGSGGAKRAETRPAPAPAAPSPVLAPPV